MAGYEIPAFEPPDRERILNLSDDDLHRILKGSSPDSKFWELAGEKDTRKDSCVQDTLLSPVAVFEGIRDNQEGGWCYVERPPRRFFNEGSSTTRNGILGIRQPGRLYF